VARDLAEYFIDTYTHSQAAKRRDLLLDSLAKGIRQKIVAKRLGKKWAAIGRRRSRLKGEMGVDSLPAGHVTFGRSARGGGGAGDDDDEGDDAIINRPMSIDEIAGLVHGPIVKVTAGAPTHRKKLTARLRWKRARRAFSVANLLSKSGGQEKHKGVAALLSEEALFRWGWNVWDLAALTPRPLAAVGLALCKHFSLSSKLKLDWHKLNEWLRLIEGRPVAVPRNT